MNTCKDNKQFGVFRIKGVHKLIQLNPPLFTVITVVLNRKDTIEKTITSVLNQEYRNIEYIIIDGGSTDGTLDVIKKYSDKISYWISEPDNGIYDAMNKGIDLCNGDGHLFLNAGDYIEGQIFSKDTKIPSLIPVLNTNIFGKQHILRTKKYLRCYRMPYNHQGILFKTDKNIKYDLRFRIAGDWYYSTIAHDLSEAKLTNTDGYIVFERGGISGIHHDKCKQEVLAISKEFQPWWIFCQVWLHAKIITVLRKLILWIIREKY